MDLLVFSTLPTILFTRINVHGTSNLSSKQLASDFLHTNMGTEVNSHGNEPLLKTVSVRFSSYKYEYGSHEILNLYSKQLASDFLPTNLFTKVNSNGI